MVQYSIELMCCLYFYSKQVLAELWLDLASFIEIQVQGRGALF